MPHMPRLRGSFSCLSFTLGSSGSSPVPVRRQSYRLAFTRRAEFLQGDEARLLTRGHVTSRRAAHMRCTALAVVSGSADGPQPREDGTGEQPVDDAVEDVLEDGAPRLAEPDAVEDRRETV